MSHIYWFDIFIIVFTIILGLKGIVNGLVKEFFGLLGVVGGVLIASRYSQETAAFIDKSFYQIQNQDLAVFIGFLAVLLIFWILCLIIGSVVSKLIKLSGLGILDRIGGFLFGSAKVFLIFAILLFCIGRIGFLDQNLRKFTQGSYTLPLLEQTGAFIMNAPSVKAGIESVSQSFDTNDTKTN
ncbi:CvpA family protein [Campylobacter sp. MIT 97-5078]|uniref:CvpA family protein n=1 Tax=Campylobacter sp. MIT 97-5078 TaxID=1548153 RepID=UPI000512AFC1|nr:CvpA family protein [Campylobacter sp. MIT 97-5078]KGI56720.1 colicin V synthesis protein [Campylobacter sp. MIT 97-5078]KGI57191.1 colicin V synthesis protein [Campylobacter sp. MIT 97-5078]TQR27576.1 CvpA family protein [Campylobacter sp. MIT 97-5078]